MSLNLEDPFNLMSDVTMNNNNDSESSISDDSNDLVNDSGKKQKISYTTWLKDYISGNYNI